MIGNFSDGLNMMAKQSAKRLWNATQVFASYHASRMTGSPRIKGFPISLSIEPTTSCNLRCPECPSGLRSFTRPTGMLKSNLFRQVIDELQSTLSYLTFYFQGEPYLHPYFLDMVEYASGKGIYTATSTNAHYLKDGEAKRTIASGLDRLIISLDGTTQETYEAYRVGGDLSKVIEGTRQIIRFKNELKSLTPHVVFQFLVVRHNEHQIKDLYKLASSLGVDQVVLKTAQVYDYENGSALLPENPKYSRYKQAENGKYEIKNSLLNHCWKMWNSCVITWDGKVVPCCFDKDAKFVLGDVNENRFYDIWNGTKYDEFRATLLKSRKDIEICRNCTEGTKVWA
jgi:radical SAM protein with 4Fe4S-binding SPASM domain